MPGPRDPRDDHAAIRRLADELLPALMARLEASPLGELEVHQDGWRVRLRKPPNSVDDPNAGPGHPTAAAAQQEAGLEGASRRPAAARTPARERSDGARPPRPVVTSPAVGIFHPRSGASPGKPVRAGDVVGSVEVLGVPQEVVAPFDGLLGRLLVESGQVVEYGEPLMRIDTAGRAGSGEAGVLEIGEGR